MFSQNTKKKKSASNIWNLSHHRNQNLQTTPQGLTYQRTYKRVSMAWKSTRCMSQLPIRQNQKQSSCYIRIGRRPSIPHLHHEYKLNPNIWIYECYYYKVAQGETLFLTEYGKNERGTWQFWKIEIFIYVPFIVFEIITFKVDMFCTKREQKHVMLFWWNYVTISTSNLSKTQCRNCIRISL